MSELTDENIEEKVEESAIADAAAIDNTEQEAATGVKAAKEKSFAHINTRAFITVLIMLVAIIILSALLPLFIRQGSYLRVDGKIDIDSFTYGEIKGIAAWRVITAPFRVFASDDALTVIMISLFLLIMSGVFNIIEKTGGIKSIIKFANRRFAAKKNLVLCLIVLIFMAFGSLFGMFEELVTLLPLVVVLALSLGFDSLTGLGMCMMAACFGFSSAITNPFSVGLASNIMGVSIGSGVLMRLILFVVVYAMVCGFLLLHNRVIAKNPQKSLTYDIDRIKLLEIRDAREEVPTVRT